VTTRKEWARQKMRTALVVMPLGLLLMIVGSFLAARKDWVLGVVLGSVGVLGLVFGALSGRLAVAGPYPAGLTVGPDDKMEVDG
jgi:hypothetical protein